jgi:hypothetical protein
MEQVMKKYFLVAGAVVALAVPSVALASQPATPGGFGTERANNISQMTPGTWGAEASNRAGTNGDQNQAWMDSHGYLPVESSLTTP